MIKWLKMAERFASEHVFDEDLAQKLCAIIVKGGNVVSVGYNKITTNSFVEHYTDAARGCGRDYCLSTHAEMSAVLKARGKIDLRGSKIYVTRVRPKGATIGRVGMAKPCPICQHVLYNYGIKRAYYTISDNEYGVLKIQNPARLYQ
jgi:deoxycytidylate deaminase